MDERLLNRRFNSALTSEQAQGWDPDSIVKEAEQNEEAALRKSDAPMDAKDATKRILLAKRDRDYFRLLELPQPEVDALDRVAWDVTPSEVSKAYRRLSVLVHPDKHSGDEAREAFEALNEAHRQLRDRGGLEEMLSKHGEAARQRREAADASATPEERVAMYAAKQQRAKLLRKKEEDTFNAEIVRQIKERKLAAQRKREIKSTYRMENRDDDPEIDGENEEGQQTFEKQEAKKATSQRTKAKKPRLIF